MGNWRHCTKDSSDEFNHEFVLLVEIAMVLNGTKI